MNELTIVKGEILTAADDIRVFCNPDLVNNRRIELSLPVGLTIHDLADKAIEQCHSRWPAKDFDVLLDGMEIPYSNWHRVRPKPGTTLAMHVVPKGIISSIIGAISAAVSTFSTLLGSLGFFGKLIMAGIGIAAKFLLNKLFAPKQPDPLPEPKVSYSITGSRNSFDAYGVVPVVLGEHRVVPGFATAPYTENIGDDQFFHMEFVVGIGPLALSDHRFGETPVAEYEDMSMEVMEGRVGDPVSILYPIQVTEEQLSIVLTFASGANQRTTATGINTISIDFVWPRGMGWFTDDGGIGTVGMYIRVEYKSVLSGTWIPFGDLGFEFATQDTKRRTVQFYVGTGQFDVRVTRLTADHTDTKVFDEVQWTALRGYRTGSPVTFTVPIAKVIIRVRGTGQLNGIIDQYNCIAKSYVTSYVSPGVWTPNLISRANADLFRAVLQHPANKRPVPDAQIDLVTLAQWKAYCTSQGFNYDKILLKENSVYDQLHEIAAAGRAMPVWKDGKWSVVWDEQNPPITQMFTPRNSWDFQEVRQYKKTKLHGVRMQFTNRDKKYAGDEFVVYNDGYTKATATELTAMEMPGVTSATAIWKHGRFFLAQDELRPGLYNLSCNWEGMQLTRNDRIYVNHDILMVGIGDGRVKAVVDAATDLITLSTPLTLDGSKAYGFVFRARDGSFFSRSVVLTTSGTLSIIPLIGSGTLPAVGDLYAFGEVGSEVGVYRVLGIEPTRDYHFRLTLVDDAPAISTADTGAIPDFDSNITVPPDPFEMPPTNIKVTDNIHQDGTVYYEMLNVSWDNPKLGKITNFETRYYSYNTLIWEKGPTVQSPTNSTIIRRLTPGNYIVGVRSVFNDGTFSRWLYSSVYSATKLTDPPPDVTNFLIQTNGLTSTLTWDPIITTFTTFEIRYAPANAVSPLWNTAVPIFQNLSGTSVQVPTNVGTYFIKATSVGGKQSVNARVIYTNITGIFDINVVATLIEGPEFLGTHDDTVTVEPGQLSLTTSNTMDKWESLDTVIDLLYGDYADDTTGFLASFGYYYLSNKINLDDVYTVRQTAIIEGSGYDPYTTMDTWVTLDQVLALDNGDAGKWGTQLEYRSTDVSDVSGPWTGWKPFFIGDTTYMAAEFRIKLFGTLSPNLDTPIGLTTALVTRVEIVIDMPDRQEKGEDILIPAGGMDIVFAYPFRGPDPLNINVTPQNMLTGEKVVVTKTPGDLTKFHVQAKDAAEAGVGTVKIDWVVTGYGRIHP